MMHHYPFFGFPSFRRNYGYPNYNYLHNQNIYKEQNSQNSLPPSVPQNKIQRTTPFSKVEEKPKQEPPPSDRSDSDGEFFEIFGIKLYFDDLLIIALLFFLYQEEVNDTYLYISLVLLLLS